MKAIQISKRGNLETVEVNISEPAKQELLVRVKASGVNFADTLMVQGIYPDAPPRPFVPGYEVAGRVEKIGEGVLDFANGDRVTGLTEFGGYAEYAICHTKTTRKIDDSMSYSEAASIPVTWLTAYHAIYNTGPVCPGSKALVHSAAGGVGLASVQLLQQAGLEVYGTAGTAKLSFLNDFGVKTVDYMKADFFEFLQSEVGKKQFDLVLDSTGIENIKKDFKLLSLGGRVVIVGAASFTGLSKLKIGLKLLRMFKVSPLHLLGSGQGIYGVNMFDFVQNRPMIFKMAFDHIIALFAEKKVKAIIDSEFRLDDAAEAHKRLLSRKSIGKVVLLTD